MNPDDPQPRCLTCRHWTSTFDHSLSNDGMCSIHPQHVIARSHHYCGQHAPAKILEDKITNREMLFRLNNRLITKLLGTYIGFVSPVSVQRVSDSWIGFVATPTGCPHPAHMSIGVDAEMEMASNPSDPTLIEDNQLTYGEIRLIEERLAGWLSEPFNDALFLEEGDTANG